MKKEKEKKEPLFGLEEINQAEMSEVDGGKTSISTILFPPWICCHDIPPRNPPSNPWDIRKPF